MPIYSLGPPRSARKVLTEKEFFEQMKLAQEESQNALEERLAPGGSKPALSHTRKKVLVPRVDYQPPFLSPSRGIKARAGKKKRQIYSGKTAPSQSGPKNPQHLTSKNLNNYIVFKPKELSKLHLGRYSVGDIVQSSKGLEFINLELPMGVFPKVLLPCDPYIARCPNARGNSRIYLGKLSDWGDYNANLAGGKESYVMPIWFYYGLMRSALRLLGFSHSPQTIAAAQTVAPVFREAIRRPESWYTSTNVYYEPGKCVWVHHGLRLPAPPLIGHYQGFFAGPGGMVNRLAHGTTLHALGPIFFEDSLEKFQQTISWAMGASEVRLDPKSRSVSGDFPIHFSYSQNFSYGQKKKVSQVHISADQDPTIRRYAIGICVDLNSFKPY